MKGGAHKAHDDENMYQSFPRHIVTGHHIGDGHANQGGGQHCDGANHQRADQGLVIVGLGEEANEVVQGHTLYLIGEDTLGDDVVEGVDDEKTHGGDDQKLDPEPEIRPPLLTESLLHLESTSPVSASYRLTRLGSKRKNTCAPSGCTSEASLVYSLTIRL